MNNKNKKIYMKFKIDVIFQQKKMKGNNKRKSKTVVEEAYEFLPAFRKSSN